MQALAATNEILVDHPVPPTDSLWVARSWLILLLLAAPVALGAVQAWAWGSLAVGSAALFMFWAIAYAQRQELSIRWSPLCLPATLFLVLGLVQFLAGLTLDHTGTREAIIKLTTNLLLFFVAGQLFDSSSRRFWRTFGVVSASYAFTLSVFATLQFFSGRDTIYWSIQPRWGGYVFGPFVNHNHYAGLLELLIPIGGVFLLVQKKNKPWRWLMGFAIAVSVASVILSGSRAGLLSLLVEGLILGAVLFRSRGFDERRTAAMASFVALLAIGLLWLLPSDVAVRFEAMVRTDRLNSADRKQMSLDALLMFRDHPLLGTGLGSFETAYTPYQRVVTDAVVDHAHNDLAEVVAETGIVGGALILWSGVIFGHRILTSDGRLRDDASGIRLGAAVGCCGLLAHSLFDFNLHIPANAAWFAVSAAISQAQSSSR